MCKEHFLRGFSAANPYDMKETRKLILSELGYEDVKGYEQKMFSDSDMIYSWCMNESEVGRIPTKQEMQAVISAGEGGGYPSGISDIREDKHGLFPGAWHNIKDSPL